MTDRRHTDWDKRQFTPNVLIATFTQFFASFISFLISYYILKKYNQQILGELVLLISAAQIFVFLTNWSLASVQKLGTEEYLENKDIKIVFSNRLLLFFINFSSIAGLYLLFYPVIKNFIPLSFSTSLIAITYGFVLALNIHFYAGFQARKMLKMQALMLLIEKLLILGSLILFLRFNTISVNKIAFTYIFSGIIITSVCFIISKSNISLKWNYPMVKKIARFSLPLIPYTVVAFFTSNYIDSFFINKYLQKGDIALYSIAYQFNGVWIQIPTILGTIILPFFITSNKHEAQATTLNYIRSYGVTINYIWSILSFLFVIGLVLVLPEFYKSFTDQFFITLFLFIISSSISFSSAALFSPYLLSKGILKIALPLALLAALCNIIGNIILIPVYGIVGCALASIIFGFLYALVLTIYISVKYRINLQSILFNNLIISMASILALLNYNIIIISVAFIFIYIFILLLNLETSKKVYTVFARYFTKT